MSSNRNLVISPVGDDSCHPTWLSEVGDRKFDLGLVYFGCKTGLYRTEADYYLMQHGFKFHLIEAMLSQLGSRLDDYDYFWLPDDDLAVATGDINRMFSIARTYGLSLAQPAIARGEVSHQIVRQKAGLLLRYTSFVEVMCPVFSRSALDRVRSTFVANKSAWGLDWAWSKLLPADELAIIDAVGVHHSRPMQSGSGYDQIRAAGVNPLADLLQMAAQYGVSARRRRQIKHGLFRVRALAADGTPTWTGRRWWQRWPRSISKKRPS